MNCSTTYRPASAWGPIAWGLLVLAVPGYGQPLPQAAHPACPQGWQTYEHPLLPISVHVPSECQVRVKGGGLFVVERRDDNRYAAFCLPLRPARRVQAGPLAEYVAAFYQRCDPTFRAQIIGTPTADRAVASFQSNPFGQPVEGRFCALITSGGDRAYIIGVNAPQGQLQANMAMLERIANGFAMGRTTQAWSHYQSPAGGFTLTMPQGWRIDSSDGVNPKSDIDWAVVDPSHPTSRAFNLAPRFCTRDFAQHPWYQAQGYQVGVYRTPQEYAAATLGPHVQAWRCTSMQPNPVITQLGRAMLNSLAQFMGGLGAGSLDFAAFDGEATGTIDGQAVRLRFGIAIRTLVANQGVMGQAADVEVTCRGWVASNDRFFLDGPVLDRIQSSYQLTPAFINRVTRGNAQAARQIADTYAQMSLIDQQIRRTHWDTQDAIAEMYSDFWHQMGGYVNEKTGRIEQIPEESLVRNSTGQLVSREEVQERGVHPDHATVLRDAMSEDYMRGVYGRIVFNP